MAHGILGGLPPGARGYLAGEQSQQQNTANQLNQAMGILGLQDALESRPLQRALLQSQVATALQNQRLRQGLLDGGTPAPQAALAQGATQGDIGPTMTNAARIPQMGQGPTGQITPQQRLMLLSGDVGMTALANAELKQTQPTDKIREAISLGYQPGTPAFNAFVGTQFTQQGAWRTDPQGNLALAPGYAQGQGQIKREEEGARAAFDLVTVPDGRGGTTLMPRSQAVTRLGGAPVAGGQPSAAPNATTGISAGFGSTPTESESAFGKELGQRQAIALLEGQKSAEDSVQIINTVGEGRKLLDSGVITGFGADFLTNMGLALKRVGIDYGGDGPANTQAFVSNMANNVGRVIKQFGSGTGLSDADREYASKIAGGSVAMDEAAIRRVFDIQEKQARWVIRNHNTKAKGVRSQIPLSVEEPSEWSMRPAR